MTTHYELDFAFTKLFTSSFLKNQSFTNFSNICYNKHFTLSFYHLMNLMFIQLRISPNLHDYAFPMSQLISYHDYIDSSKDSWHYISHFYQLNFCSRQFDIPLEVFHTAEINHPLLKGQKDLPIYLENFIITTVKNPLFYQSCLHHSINLQTYIEAFQNDTVFLIKREIKQNLMHIHYYYIHL